MEWKPMSEAPRDGRPILAIYDMYGESDYLVISFDVESNKDHPQPHSPWWSVKGRSGHIAEHCFWCWTPIIAPAETREMLLRRSGLAKLSLNEREALRLG